MKNKKNQGIGPTGQFPNGKINKDDEGELAIGIASDVKNNVVVIEFGKSIQWIGFPPEQAIEFANMIMKASNEMLKNKLN